MTEIELTYASRLKLKVAHYPELSSHPQFFRCYNKKLSSWRESP